MKEKVLALMSSMDHCVISSIGSDDKPQFAFVGFSEDENLELVIGTSKESRKCKNILANPNVSVVIADVEKKLEIQYEGQAEIINATKLAERLELHFKKVPAAAKRLSDPNQVWIKISPEWIRYVDANEIPMKFEEMRQFE